MQSGPIQLIAVAFDRVDQFRGQILRELDLLRTHGQIRVIDLQFVMKEADGTVHSLQERDGQTDETTELGALVHTLLGMYAGEPGEGGALPELMLSAEGGLSLGEIRNVAAALPPGTAVALVVIEHAWAIGLGTAITEAGGRMVAQGFLTRDALLSVGRELNAIVEAEVAVERAAALRGAAMLDALTTVALAEEVQQAAIAEAAATVAGVDAFKGAIAAEAVRALVVAGLLTDADASEALEILVDAELITTDAFQHATEATDAAIAELNQSW